MHLGFLRNAMDVRVYENIANLNSSEPQYSQCRCVSLVSFEYILFCRLLLLLLLLLSLRKCPSADCISIVVELSFSAARSASVN